MEPPEDPHAEPPNGAVLDATTVIHLAKQGRLDILASLASYRFYVAEEVVAEVTRPEQRARLHAALEAGYLRQVRNEEITSLSRYAEFRMRMGRGEAASLAISEANGWLMVSDDRGRVFRRMARECLGNDRLLSTRDLLDMARRENLLSEEEYRKLAASLEE